MVNIIQKDLLRSRERKEKKGKVIIETDMLRFLLLLAGLFTWSSTISSEAWMIPSAHRRKNMPTLGIDNKSSPLAGRKSLSFLASTVGNDANTSEHEQKLPSLNLYNSKSRRKENLKPVKPGEFSMYTCGPTVYDFAHVGNFRAFLTYDLLKRVLLYFGYDVTHICNLTDVDDKIIKRANEQNLKSTKELTLKYEALFFQDLEALNILKADKYPRATEHVTEMMDMILKLQENGLAYETTDGSWYFRTAAKEGYGQQLVNFSTEEGWTANDGNDNGSDDRISSLPTTDDKEHFQDFCLWKAFKPNLDREDLAWSSSCKTIKKGRPGWHLECSAMAQKYFGEGTIDLHGGGIDLQFPHHENEIAQSEGATGNNFCNCWFHNGFVNINDEKMSKSLGNFLTLRTACPQANDIRAYRYLVMSSQYRSTLSFTSQATKAAKNALKRIDKVKLQVEGAVASASFGSSVIKDDCSNSSSSSISILATEIVPSAIKNFEAALRDDLNMPRASASMFDLVKAAENEFKRVNKKANTTTGSEIIVDLLDVQGLKAILVAMAEMDTIFGIFYDVPAGEEEGRNNKGGKGNIPHEVMKLVEQRTMAKESKDWDLADSLRNHIVELGYTVKDVKDGEPIVSQLE